MRSNTRRKSILTVLAVFWLTPTLLFGQATVKSTADSGTGSLRDAILAANAAGGSSEFVISFDILGTGVQTITLASQLPVITRTRVTIDGTTQTGTVCNSPIDGSPHTLKIELDGSLLSGGAHGLEANASARGLKVVGLSIHSFPGSGVYSQAPNTTVACSYLGVEANGDPAGNGLFGADLHGDVSLMEISVASDNGDSGVRLSGREDTLRSSLIGTDVKGTAALGNGKGGVLVAGDAVHVGGIVGTSQNVISGNLGDGVDVASGLTGCEIQGNYIGTNYSVDSAIPNADGIELRSPCDIGNGDADGLNVVSGNNSRGITMGSGAVGSTVIGNFVGTDTFANLDLGNGQEGIVSTDTVTVGESTVVFNGGSGIVFNGNACKLWGSFVGAHTGTSAMPNAEHGVVVKGNATEIGPLGANVISGNTLSGIKIDAGSLESWIRDNWIGVAYNATAKVGNQEHGIQDEGGSSTLQRNYVGGNGLDGIHVAGAVGPFVWGNYIGTDDSGLADLGNSRHGIWANNAIRIGDAVVADRRNVVAYNGSAGVALNAGTVPILRNSIHSNGVLGIDLDDDGITYNDSGDGDVGGNDLQNFPIIKPITYTGPGTVDVIFQMNSTPNDSFRVEIFIVDPPDPSGFGEGDWFIGTKGVRTDGLGRSTDTLTFDTSTLSLGTSVSATATRIIPPGDYGPTSEFSNAEQVSERINLTSYLLLEGAYAGGGIMYGHGAFLATRPTAQPYGDDSYNGTLLEVDDPLDVGVLSPDVLDWIVLSIRTGTAAGTEVARQVGLVATWQRVSDPYEVSPVSFEGIPAGSYYVVACHRNHLCAMSDTLLDFSSGYATHDFTESPGYSTAGPAQKDFGDGYYGLFAGNPIPDAVVDGLDLESWYMQTDLGAAGYRAGDCNLDGKVQALDGNLIIANMAADRESQVP